MRIKKKELRKREAQLPINYPAPTVASPFDYESEKGRVENLCKRLAHNEVEVRDAVLAELPRYLKELSFQVSRVSGEDLVREMSNLELVMMKLCLGIHYCFWHSDKPLVQHECAFKISQLFFAPTTNTLRMMFVRCMFRILAREWNRIDHYRLDKYMALVRKLVFQMICFLCQVAAGEPVHPVTLKAEGPFISATEDAVPKRKLSAKKGVDASTDRSLFGNILSEVTTLFQDHVLLNTTSVGLTLHLCDLFFDELCRAKASVEIFVQLSKAIPCFAMSRGNYVEKRVLDNFFAPLTGGVLESRWGEERSADIQAIYKQMAAVCKEYSVQKGTVRSVRVMFSEAQLLLEQKIGLTEEADQMMPVRRRDLKTRVRKEVEEANSTRMNLAKELDGARMLKRKERKSALRTFEKATKTGGEVDPRVAAIARAAEARARKKAATRSTKRKKIVKLKKSDFK